MIERTFCAETVNAILNAPTVRPTIGGAGDLDISDLLADQRNICLINEHGGMMFAWRGPGVFEVHCFFLARGKQAIASAKDMLELMAGALLWAPAPEARKDVRWFARKVGFLSHGLMDTPEGRCELFVMR